MTLALAHSLTLASLKYDAHAAEIAVTLAWLPRGGSARVRLPAALRFEAEPGDDAELVLDGGEAAETVLTGQVVAVRRRVEAIEVLLADAGCALGRLRPSASFERQPAAGIVRKLAGDAGVTAGTIDLDLDLPVYAAHPGRTAAEHVARLAEWGNAMALVDADGTLAVRAIPEGPAGRALLSGREIIAVSLVASAPVNPKRFRIGSGPAGNMSAPDALRPAAGPLPDSADNGGAGVLRTAAPALRTPAAATSASGAASGAAARAGARLELRCFLLPAVRPGQVIEIQGLPAGLPRGPFLVTQVDHRLNRATGETTVRAEALAPPDLLGALLGALGGLL